MAQNVEVGLTSRAEKILHQRFDHGTFIASPKFQIRMLHFKHFGQDLYLRIPKKTLFFLQIVKIKTVISLLFSLFIFTEKSL